jgi:UDP-N-acetylglucosamine 1-carboxyvinyltransferase
MGASIRGVGSNVLEISGVARLSGCEFRLGADYMEVGSLIGLAAATRGELEIEEAGPLEQRMTRIVFGKLGIRWETDHNSILVPATQTLRVVPDLAGMIPKIDDGPAFSPDLMSIALVVATQVDGTTLIHEKMFESRLFFVDKLIDMGAQIILCDPHRAVVSGRSRLRPAELSSPDIRAGMALLIAALCAEGESTIQNVYQIERGHEAIVERLRRLGAKIERCADDSPRTAARS